MRNDVVVTRERAPEVVVEVLEVIRFAEQR
jgi:hypothetical protein